MKLNKITLSIMMLSIVGAGACAYHFTENKDKFIEEVKPVIVEKNIDTRIKVGSLTDENALFHALYRAIDKNSLKKTSDLEAYEVAKENNYPVSYIDGVLAAYQYKGIKKYINIDGEERYLVSFSHRSAIHSNSLVDENSNLDLFLFKKVRNEYVLIARTLQEGLINGSPGSKAVDDVIFDHVMNSEPLKIGPKYNGYIVNFLTGVSGGSVNLASIIVMDEQKAEIYSIDPENDNIEFMREDFGGGEPKFKFDSFYYLDKTKENNGIYNLEVFTEGTKNLGTYDKPQVKSYDVHRTYVFDGKSYKLLNEDLNQFSSGVNPESYEKYFSTINNDGYAPIPYESFKGSLDGYFDYWLTSGLRYFKPFTKTNDFYSWKVRGVQLSGLKVIGVMKGVCDIHGGNTCGWASQMIIVLDANVSEAKKVLGDQISYTNKYLNEQSATNVGLYPVEFNGEKKAAISFMSEAI